MTIEILRARDRLATPWKNGGGVTREIAVFPPGASLDAFTWRVSMASVTAGGPFSLFPGVNRVLAVLEGDLDLEFADGRAAHLTPASTPLAFPGDLQARARTPGASVTDLNIMVRRGRVEARVELVRLVGSHVLAGGETTLFFFTSPGARLQSAGAGLDLGAYDGLLLAGQESQTVELWACAATLLYKVDFTTQTGSQDAGARP